VWNASEARRFRHGQRRKPTRLSADISDKIALSNVFGRAFILTKTAECPIVDLSYSPLSARV
jgi:hypothetical protein